MATQEPREMTSVGTNAHLATDSEGGVPVGGGPRVYQNFGKRLFAIGFFGFLYLATFCQVVKFKHRFSEALENPLLKKEAGEVRAIWRSRHHQGEPAHLSGGSMRSEGEVVFSGLPEGGKASGRTDSLRASSSDMVDARITDRICKSVEEALEECDDERGAKTFCFRVSGDEDKEVALVVNCATGEVSWEDDVSGVMIVVLHGSSSSLISADVFRTMVVERLRSIRPPGFGETEEMFIMIPKKRARACTPGSIPDSAVWTFPRTDRETRVMNDGIKKAKEEEFFTGDDTLLKDLREAVLTKRLKESTRKQYLRECVRLTRQYNPFYPQETSRK
ncbi:MAG: hypothetical protein OXF02_05020 [Simkaniaceae bacterium]|nr:hypothetical protein [Simkaniaceae bacterium]